jgi:hypothetical protein
MAGTRARLRRIGGNGAGDFYVRVLGGGAEHQLAEPEFDWKSEEAKGVVRGADDFGVGHYAT